MASANRIREALPEMGLDAVLLTTPESIYHYTDTAIWTQKLIPDRLALALISEDPSADSLIVCSIELAQAERETTLSHVVPYSEFVESPIRVASETIISRGLGDQRLGIELGGLRPDSFAELQQSLDGAVFSFVDGFLERSRSVKDASELRTMREGARITDETINEVFEMVDGDWTELEVVQALRNRVELAGASGVAFSVLAAGDRANQGHPEPSKDKLGAPTTMRTDFGAYFGTSLLGHMSDVARTKAIGQPSARLRDAYARLFDTHMRALDALRPGVHAQDIYETVKKSLENHGLTFRMPHVGHGIGLRVHEYPMLRPGNEAKLEAGMVLAIEPIIIEDNVILQVEDMVEITETGYQLLSDPNPWSQF